MLKIRKASVSDENQARIRERFLGCDSIQPDMGHAVHGH